MAFGEQSDVSGATVRAPQRDMGLLRRWGGLPGL